MQKLTNIVKFLLSAAFGVVAFNVGMYLYELYTIDKIAKTWNKTIDGWLKEYSVDLDYLKKIGD